MLLGSRSEEGELGWDSFNVEGSILLIDSKKVETFERLWDPFAELHCFLSRHILFLIEFVTIKKMDLNKQRRNILHEINDQVLSGNKALDEMRKRTKSIIEHESRLEDMLLENETLRTGAEAQFEALLDRENELYDLQLEAQENLIEIQSMRTKLEATLTRSLPKYRIATDRLERIQSNMDKISKEEGSHRQKLASLVSDYQRMKSEAEMINRFKRGM